MAALTHPSGSTRALAYHLTNSPDIYRVQAEAKNTRSSCMTGYAIFATLL